MYKEQVETMLENHVFPTFVAPEGFLRAQACWVVSTFNELKFRKKGVLEKAILLLRDGLVTDKELPVKVEAAIAIQSLLAEQDRGELTIHLS